MSNKYLTSILFLIFYASPNQILKAKDKFEYKTYIDKIQFIPTTKVTSNIFFTLGGVQSPLKSESIHATIETKTRISTSFNGDDNLLAIFESGNAQNSPLNLDLQSKKGDNIKISTLLYKFPLNDGIQITVGPKMFGYHGLAGKSTLYNERYAILDGSNYTTSSGIGPGIAIAARNKKGLNASLKLASNSQIIDEQTRHAISQIGFNKRFYGGTITSNFNNNFNAVGLAAYFKPEKLPSLNFSIEQKEFNTKKNYNWIFGLQNNINDITYGLGVGSHNENEDLAYEGWSEIAVTDKLKLIPIIFIRENSHKESDLGISINTKFSF